MKKLISFVAVFAAFIFSKAFAQIPLNYVFTQDSLKGFDEVTAGKMATQNNCFGNEYKSYMYKAKRKFINEKYHLAGHDHDANNIVWKTVSTASVQPGCTNMDFETGTLAGWTHTSGSNNNSITMGGCCPTNGGVASVINGAGTDPLVSAVSLVSPLGGTKIVKLNDNNYDYSVQRISQTFNVTSSNAIFQFAYAGILEDAGHSCTDQPYMNVSVIDSAGHVLPCPYIPIAAPSAICTQASSITAGWVQNSSAGVYYHTWQVKTIDLSPYIGSFITIQITVGDCAQGGHFGYGYFDCKCYPLEISLNSTIYDATPQTPINISTCGAITGTIIAPYGLNPYSWDGPAGSGITAVSSQSIATSTPGTYTLTMSPSGSCYGDIVKYIILNVSPNPTVTNVTAQATCTNATGSGTINVNSGTAPFTYNWSPAAATGSVATGLAPGTDYTVTVVDTFGCQNNTVVSIASFTDAPTYTINPLSANLTCLTPSLTVTANTGTNSVAVWTHTTTSGFDVSAPGSYSCVITNTVSTCTATVPITITSNTIAPVATYTVNCNSSTVSFNASSSTGIALGWLAPTTPPTPISNPGSSTASGIFTLTATNLNTGCKTTYTVESTIPTLSITNTPNTNLLTCNTQTISSLAGTNSGSATITWFNGVTTTTVNPNPITVPGTYTAIVQAAGGCSTQSVITVSQNTVAGISVTSASTVIPCSTNSLALSAFPTTGGSYSYTWSPSASSATGSVYNVSNAGTYTVTALNATNGCTTTATYAVSHETVTASFVPSVTQGLMPLAVTFSNTSVNATDYSWNLGNSSVADTNVHTATVYNYQGTYTVVLTATNGFCTDTATRLIYVELVSFFTVPNVFTPNGDGKNDVFTFDAVNMGEITFTVFDRWGIKMFDATESGNVKWDGKTKSGNTVSDGTYFYIIKAKGLDAQTYDLQGTINVFR